ncbi:DEAD/DEAH box helicase [Infirmifilum sp.]|uniref:DEAD/DEAH box helicase n=1 Tax=Infirmifilum sp. TaxID=2856575 RepID=UPI003D1089E3
MLDTGELLKRLGLEFYAYVEGGIEPEKAEVTFREILKASPSSPRLDYLLDKRLYKHQYMAYQELVGGKNIVLKSGTGSGKTEAWWLYAATHHKKVLAVYPTLALSYDQLSRLSEYCRALGLKISQVDSTSRSKREGKSYPQVKSEIRASDIVVTNPAFLLMDIKRVASKPSSSLLLGFLNELNLLVLDEVDFYSPRELSLLLALVRIIASLREGIQVAVLTATLSNPEDMCSVLREYTGRECSIVDGTAFRREDRYYIVLGRNLKDYWNNLRDYKSLLIQSGNKEIIEAMEDYEKFRRNIYKVLDALQTYGVETHPPRVDPVDIIKHYIDDEYVTLVFTRSINRAEELYRKLRELLPDEKKELVASHHHLVSKEKRQNIEDLTRQGKIKVIISPRTLTQGIDIGLIARVVHVGLPDDVREFRQRNGRKGRRETIPYTETVIFPGSRWDRELLSRGVDVLREWIDSPPEITLVNPDNRYGFLFYSLFKVKSGQRLNQSEAEFLEKLGLYLKGQLTKKGERTWYNINFYEFAPPYGIKRVYVDEESEKFLEDISFSDLVEKFQVGCIDYSSDGVVTSIQKGGEAGRAVRKVVVQPLSENILYRFEPFTYAIEEYKKIKAKWGERASLFYDYLRGRLLSEAISNVIPPTSGFGMYHKYPWKTVWIVEREHGRPVETEAGTIIVKDRRVVEIPALTAGKYQDYTYGRLIELDHGEDLRRIRLGLAFLMVFLREKYRLPLFTFSYSLSSLGGRKTLVLWEEECAGLVEKMDWGEIYRELELFTPSQLSEVLLLARDEEAHIEWIGLGGRWNVAKELAKKVVGYILLSDKIAISLKGKELYVPKPGKHLKLASLDLLLVPLDEKGDIVYGYLAFFNGEEVIVEKITKEFYTVQGEGEVVRRLQDSLNNGFKILVFDIERLREEMHMLGLTYHAALLSGLIQMKLVKDTRKTAEQYLGVEVTGLEHVISNLPENVKAKLGINSSVSLADVERELANSRNWLGKRLYRDHSRGTRFLDDASKALADSYVRTIYLLGLILEEEKRSTENMEQNN